MANYFKIAEYFSKILFFGIKYPVGMSIDVTNKCNLRCKHCYFFQQNQEKELSDSELLNRIKVFKKAYPSMEQATWVGGEPLLRKDLIIEGMKLFPFNMIVTNGTKELPNWKNCVFNVSVDGTKKYYEKIRGAGLYEKVKMNADRDDIRVNIACVLNKENYFCIEDLLEEWAKTKVRGVTFDFYTPIRGIKSDLWLNWQERDQIIRKLMDLRKKYGGFLLDSEPVLELMLSENSQKLTTNCIVPKAVVCMDSAGNIKRPCVMGNKADCSRCGCIIPFLIESFAVRKQLGTFTSVKNGFT